MAVPRLPEEDPATLPPHDDDAERALLGAVLKRPDVMAQLTGLAVEDFYQRTYRGLWHAMRSLWDHGIPVDGPNLTSKLKAPEYARAGITAMTLAELDLTAAAPNVAWYAQTIQTAATRRRYIDAAQQIAQTAWRDGADLNDLIAFAEAQLASVRPRTSRQHLLSPEQRATNYELGLEARLSGERKLLRTGLVDMDRMLIGLAAGGLYLLMATPGSGKSELSQQIAQHVAQHYGPVLFASLEMTDEELDDRYARQNFGMDRNRLVTGKLTEEEWSRYPAMIEALRTSGVWTATPTGKYTTTDLRADALDVMAQAGKPALIVADYVQRFGDNSGRGSSREENVGMAAKGLKDLAREIGCPVLAPVQPNREYAQRTDKEPKLADLRESGKLEQEADVVLGLFRPELHYPSGEIGVAEVSMLKNRSGVGDTPGSGGVRKLRWIGHQFGNYAANEVLP